MPFAQFLLDLFEKVQLSSMAASSSFKKLSDVWWKKVEPIGPIRLNGSIVKGHQRGREIGIKTANLDPTAFPQQLHELIKAELNEGVYIGYGRVDNGVIYKNILSIGTNPHFGNKNITVVTYLFVCIQQNQIFKWMIALCLMMIQESHLLHEFEEDFYDSHLRVLITGFVRPSVAFGSMDDLIKAINRDIEFGADYLDKEPHRSHFKDKFITKIVQLPINGNDDDDDDNDESKESDGEGNAAPEPLPQHKPKSSL